MSHAEPIYKILLVCTGNTCRSAMAEAYMRRELGAEAEQVRVSSAGTAAWEDQRATPLSMEVTARDGVDLKAHRSRRLKPEMVREADLILVMERAHLAAVKALGADPSKVHVLSEFPPPGEPSLAVSDPFGASIEAYEECWQRIQRHVERIVPHIREALRARSA